MDNQESAPTPTPRANELTKRQILNNHIIHMRKSIRQAKVHVISKLTKEIRKLKANKGDEKKVEKAQRKAERLLTEITVIKHLKEDKVSIYALRNKLSLTDVLQNSKETPENRVFARLAHHSSVEKQVLKYREENPHWALQIPVLLENSLKKEKKKKKADSSDNILQTKTIVKKEKKAKQEQTTADKEESHLESDEDISLPKNKNKSKSAFKEKLSVESLNSKFDKIEGTLKIKQLKEDLSDLLPLVQNTSDSEEKEDRLTDIKRKPKSSFFIGGVDEEIKDDEKVHTSINVKHKKYSNNSIREPSKQIYKKGKLVRKPVIKPNNRAPRYFEKDEEKKKHFATNSKGPGVNSVPSTTEKLHPSWEAKKRLQQSPFQSSFQGKKIKFDDNE